MIIRNGNTQLYVRTPTHHCAQSGKSLASARCMRLGGFLSLSLLRAAAILADWSCPSSSCITSIRPCITQQWIGIRPCKYVYQQDWVVLLL